MNNTLSDKNNQTLIAIVLILILALLIRLGIAYSMRDTFFERGNRYSSINPIALNIITNHQFSIYKNSPTAINEPLYPSYVALSYFLLGYNWLAIAVTQSAVNIVNSIIIFFLALKVFSNKRIALVSLMMFLFYPFYVFQCISVSDTILFCFFLSLSVYLTFLVSINQNTIKSLITGCSWGLTLLTRFSAISILLFVLVAIFLLVPKKQAFMSLAIIIGGCLLTLSPWIYRNYSITEKIFISTHGAIEIWLGYNKETFHVIKNDISVDKMKKDLLKKIPELEEITKKQYPASIFREVEESRVFINHAIDFALKNPWLSLKMLPVKFWKFWSWNYNPVPTCSDPFQDKMRRLVYTISYLPILILGLSGIIMARKSLRSHSLLLLIFLGYSVLHAVVFGFSRLRIPIDQFLMIYAAYTAVYLFNHIRKNVYKTV